MKIPRTTQIKDNRKSFGEYTIVRTWSAVKKTSDLQYSPSDIGRNTFYRNAKQEKLKSYIVNVVEKKLNTLGLSSNSTLQNTEI